ncbi:MAG: hypothetical protein CL565_06425 [Alphaproteobacteria bacterium]|nr:hypothetical protein [Alphaproteobacteria bacterium]|tara:strand:- start:1685 stop:2446 length:762 start_codon:yes stop_codon:yes gene_type:complete
MTDISPLIDKYYTWLKDKTAWKTINKWVEITAPYLDRNNDYIQIYLQKTNNGFLLTDDGATIMGLKQEGCSLDSEKRKKLLTLTLNGYGVSLNGNELQITATEDNFALRKHSLVQAILAVNDMFYLAESHVHSLFFEDVRGWLDTNDIRYSEQISFIGRSGYARKFDFLISKSSKAPERILKTINNPVRNSADSIIVDWIDTKEIRPTNSKAYAVVNDNDRNVSSNVLDALNSYDIKPILWSEREKYNTELAA